MASIERILCPVDNSIASQQALRQAAVIADHTGADLVMLHVVARADVSHPEMVAIGQSTLPDEERRRMHRWMEADAAATMTRVRPTLIVRVGHVADEILAHASALGADLIAMSTHGRTGFRHLVLGSVAENVLRRASCPVLTVPPLGIVTGDAPFRRVLCAIDFSECSLRALEFAMTTAIDAGAELLLAHVLEWPWVEPPAPTFTELPEEQAVALSRYRAQREAEAWTRLRAIAPQGWSERCRPLVAHGRSHQQLLQLAASHHADLIVMGVHGHGALDRAMFGSTTHQIIRRALCPVLTVTH